MTWRAGNLKLTFNNSSDQHTGKKQSRHVWCLWPQFPYNEPACAPAPVVPMCTLCGAVTGCCTLCLCVHAVGTHTHTHTPP
ncbi:hypothetical protein FKM82_026399 [Ascaphus truei]